MPYTIQTAKEIPNWLVCPFCGEYGTKYKTHLMNHFKTCQYYFGHIDDVLSYSIDTHFSVEDFIQQSVNVIYTTKEFIRTNELQLLATKSPEEIIFYIKGKLLKNLPQYYISFYSDINIHALNIYEFFFGETEEIQKKIINEYFKFFKMKI